MNPYGLTNEQMQLYSDQVAGEKRDRANGLYAEGACSVHEFCEWMREWFRREREIADQIKFGQTICGVPVREKEEKSNAQEEQ